MTGDQTDELRAALEEAEAQRRRYRDLFENAPLPYLSTDPAGKVVEANVAAATLLGLTRDQLVGKPLQSFLSGGPELGSRINRIADGRSVQPWQSELRRRGGDTIPVEVSARGMQGSGARASEIRWVVQDQRERLAALERERELNRQRAARAALEQVASRAAFLAEASGRLMGVLEADRVWQVSAELAASQGSGALALEDEPRQRVRVRGIAGDLPVRQELGISIGDILDLDDPGTTLIPVDPVRRARANGEAEVVRGAEHGPSGAGSCLIVPIRSAERSLGVLILWLTPGARIGEELIVARNLADRIALALEAAALFEEVVRARRQAEEASTAEADFLAVVSHELRTPLTAIGSYAELLGGRAEEMPGRLGHYARQIAAAAEHQRQLVEQVLSYRKLNREEISLDPEPLDFRKAVRSAVSMVRPQLGDRGIDLKYDVPSVPVQGVSDRGKLQQILTNLLTNAIRHTHEGHVRITLETEDQWVVMRVEDTGDGIRAEELPRVFDRFWRGSGSERERGGTGLGLTITRELVGRLKGEIRVESEHGAGTTFTVRLPRVMPGGRGSDSDPLRE